MEVVDHNTIKLNHDERIFEVISLIKPTHDKEKCTFLEGHIWGSKKTYYNNKLANRFFHVVNHHIYSIYHMEGPNEKVSYWLVSGRGNVNPISYEQAFALVNERVGYVEDSDLAELGPNTEPSIPYQVNQDW